LKGKYEDIGFLAIRNGHYQEAVNIFKRALEENRSSRAYMGLGMAYYYLESYHKSRWALYKALEIFGENKEIQDLLAKVEEKLKNNGSYKNPRSLFRAKSDYLEIRTQGAWEKIFLKGINIGLGLPGYFPGEYPIEKGTYRRWFKLIAELGVNTIRVYTIMPSQFYEALYEFNRYEGRLYLLQGIWYELPLDHNFSSAIYLDYIHRDIRNAVNVIYGNANLPERPGYASGTYNFDVSAYTIGLLLSREPENCAVKLYNELNKRETRYYSGQFLEIKNATPFEAWAVSVCDFIQSYEMEKYGLTHPVSMVNWPTLDPINHWSEANYEDELRMMGESVELRGCVENEDEETLDFTKIRVKEGAGFFLSYHVYPAFPDFMIHDYMDREDPYRAYLTELKNYHKNQPIVIAEFGMSSSRDYAHWHNKGWHHGGHEENEQGRISELLLKDIYETGMAGAIKFSLFDEWYKKTWNFAQYYIPLDRKKSWFNIQDPENNYGLIGTYPNYPDKKVTLSGNRSEWQKGEVLYSKSGNMIFKFNDGYDNSRSLRTLAVQHDEGFLYIMLETEGKIDFSNACYLIGIDTCCPDEGEYVIPFNTNIESPIGLKFLIHLCGKENSRILSIKGYEKFLNADSNSIRPQKSRSGEWVPMFMKTNRRRISKDGSRFFPGHVTTLSNLKFGTLERNSLSDFFVSEKMIEIRLPWSLIGFTDPSSRTVLWKSDKEITKKTDGVRLISLSYKPQKGKFLAENTGRSLNVTDALPFEISSNNIKTYTWDEWETPLYHFYLKKSYHILRQALKNIPERIK